MKCSDEKPCKRYDCPDCQNERFRRQYEMRLEAEKEYEKLLETSAARIERLERLCDATEQQLTRWRNKYNHAIETGVVKIADEQERIAELEAGLERLNTGIKAAYGTLQMYGVPELRAKSVANGIMVLVSRIDKESEFQAQELANRKTIIDELQADCKAMAEGMLNAHERTYGMPCTCPACIIAAKYRKGK